MLLLVYLEDISEAAFTHANPLLPAKQYSQGQWLNLTGNTSTAHNKHSSEVCISSKCKLSQYGQNWGTFCLPRSRQPMVWRENSFPCSKSLEATHSVLCYNCFSLKSLPCSPLTCLIVQGFISSDSTRKPQSMYNLKELCKVDAAQRGHTAYSSSSSWGIHLNLFHLAWEMSSEVHKQRPDKPNLS